MPKLLTFISKSNIPALLLLFVLTFFSWKALLAPGFFKIHDSQHVVRLFELNKVLLAGQFPVRWVPDLGFGFGYALFNFYPPFIYYLGEFFHLIFRTGFLDSIKIVWATALIGSAIAMYFFSKEFFGKIAGVVAAIFYLYAPYHAVDAYVRGALAELFSFVWLPLILLFSSKLIRSRSRTNLILTGFFLSLLMLTHPLIFLPFFAIYSIWHFAWAILYDKKYFVQHTINFISASFLSFGLSAFFWVPSILEKKYTLTDQFLTQGLASYKIHFVCLSQLWNSPWGFGGSVPGCFDGISFMLGRIYIFMTLLSVFLLIVMFLRKKQMLHFRTVIISLTLLILSFLMTTPYSKFIWDNFQPLWYLQFPWRFLEFSSLFSSMLAGAVIYLLQSTRVKIIAAVTSVAVLLVVQTKYFVPQSFDFSASDNTLTTNEQIKWIVSSTSFEYMPKGLPVRIEKNGSNMLDIKKSEIVRSEPSVISGDFEIIQFDNNPGKMILNGKTVRGAIVQFPQTYFPGWEIEIDRKKIPIDNNNRYQLIRFDVPSGQHNIVGTFTDTPIRKLGNMISSIAALVIFCWLIYGSRASKSKNS